MSRHLVVPARRAAGRSLKVKLAVSAAIAASAAAVAGLGTFGSFTATTSASQDVSTGTVSLTGTDNTFSTAATGLVPGDTVSRQIKLVNNGNQDLATVSLGSAVVGAANALTTDTTNGLKVTVTSCPTAWTAGTNNTYSCSGGTTTVLASRSALISSPVALSGLAAQTAGGTSYLLVTLTLPTGADNSFQGLTTSLSWTFSGTQRAATTK